jgi:hypothetical protein
MGGMEVDTIMSVCMSHRCGGCALVNAEMRQFAVQLSRLMCKVEQTEI